MSGNQSRRELTYLEESDVSSPDLLPIADTNRFIYS